MDFFHRSTELKVKCRPFVRHAFHGNRSAVPFHHLLHVKQAESVSLHFVAVSVRYSVEFVEDIALFFLCDADAVVCNADFYSFPLRPFPAIDTNIDVFFRVFDGIVYQVSDHVVKVEAVGEERQGQKV